MIKTTKMVLLVAFTIQILIANAVTITEPSPEGTKSLENVVYTKNDIVQLIDKIAQEKAISASIMHNVIACESSYNPNALGDAGHSRGLVQIYDDYHPNVTHEQAYDPEFAITFLADAVKSGRGYLWTCYRMQYGG